MPHKYLLKEFEELARSAANPEIIMQRVSQRIHTHIPRYNWVGFYLVDSNDPSVLMLGPHTGSFTPKAKISWNEGLCGSAAASAVTDEKRAEPKAAPPICFTASRREIPLLPLSIALALACNWNEFPDVTPA